MLQLVSEARMAITNLRQNPSRSTSPFKEATVPSLLRLKEKLLNARAMDDKLSGIVLFFDAVSKWHDCNLGEDIVQFKSANFRGQYNETIRKLETLDLHFHRAGRSEFGWNRTKYSERVTDNNVFLGNIFGLWTFPVSEWRKYKDEPKGSFAYLGGNMAKFNAYDVVSNQAGRFMTPHINAMCELIDWLCGMN